MSWKIIAAMVLAMALMAGGFGLYFKWSQAEFKKRDEAAAAMKIDIENKQLAIDDLSNRLVVLDQLYQDYNVRLGKIRADTDRLKGRVTDITDRQETAKDPRAAEEKINTFTKDLFGDLESISRGEKVESEKK